MPSLLRTALLVATMLAAYLGRYAWRWGSLPEPRRMAVVTGVAVFAGMVAWAIQAALRRRWHWSVEMLAMIGVLFAVGLLLNVAADLRDRWAAAPDAP